MWRNRILRFAVSSNRLVLAFDTAHVLIRFVAHIFAIFTANLRYRRDNTELQHKTALHPLAVAGLSNTLQFLHRTLPIGEFEVNGIIAK